MQRSKAKPASNFRTCRLTVLEGLPLFNLLLAYASAACFRLTLVLFPTSENRRVYFRCTNVAGVLPLILIATANDGCYTLDRYALYLDPSL